MKSLQRNVRAGLAAGLTAMLVAGTVHAVATPAQAAAPQVDPASIGGTFNWKISDQVVARYGTRVVTDGAFETTGGEVAFPIRSASSTGDQLTVSYAGSFDSQFAFGGTFYYSTKVEDPTVTIDADGSGELSAVVSGITAASSRGPAEETTPARVVVGEFDASTGDLSSTLTATISAFSPAFVSQVTSGTRSHFDGTTEVKKPAPFVLKQPAVTGSVQSVGGVDRISATGSDFFGGDANYNGVYVGLAVSGGQPDTSTQAGMAAYAGQDWVMPARITNGSFTSGFDVESDEIVAGKSYSLYTWQAHKHSSRSLDSEFVLGVLKEATVEPTPTVKPTPKPTVKKATKATTKVARKATRKKAGKLTVTVKAGRTNATGKVTLAIKAPGKKSAKKVVTLKRGKAAVALPKAKKKGTYKVTVAYKGAAKFKAAKKKVVKFRVK